MIGKTLGHTSTAHTRAYIDAEDYQEKANGVGRWALIYSFVFARERSAKFIVTWVKIVVKSHSKIQGS
jgi:hypothetical protein